jgi:hypothetical protein
VSGGSDMNIAPWLSRATLDMSVSSLRCVTTLCTNKLTLSQLLFRIGRGLLADPPREVNGVLTLSIQSAAFDYDCRALDGPNDPLVRSYENFMCVDDTPFRSCVVTH